MARQRGRALSTDLRERVLAAEGSARAVAAVRRGRIGDLDGTHPGLGRAARLLRLRNLRRKHRNPAAARALIARLDQRTRIRQLTIRTDERNLVPRYVRYSQDIWRLQS